MEWPKQSISPDKGKFINTIISSLNRQTELKVPEKGLAHVHIYISQECFVYLQFLLLFPDAFLSCWKDASPGAFISSSLTSFRSLFRWHMHREIFSECPFKRLCKM